MLDLLVEPVDPAFEAWLADVPEPDWLEHPVYAEQATDDRLSSLLGLPPAARPTAALASISPERLSAGERVDLLRLLEEQRNWLEAAQVRVLAVIEDSDSTELGLAQEEVSLALTIPTRTAQTRLKAARSLMRELPATLRLLTAGKITGRHAQLITEASWQLPTEVVARFEARIAERAGQQTLGQLRQSLRRAAIALDPATAEARHRRALADRRVGFQAVEDGMVELPVLLGAVEGQLIYTRLTAAACLLPATDPRTMDQKRADLLVDAVLSGLPDEALPRMQGRRPAIQVVVSADTLLNLNDQPAHLTGYGAITAATARRLAADQSGTWRRLLTDPDTGQLLDIGERSYRPAQRLRDYVHARDDTCAFPTCNQPGYRCEYDHITPFSHGGTTTRRNGALACRRHNNSKNNTGWSYRLNEDGSFTWTSTTRRNYLGQPPERWGTAAEHASHQEDADEPPF
ncbi:MAG TPA: DUF222 domain-containing protein [Jatrophihabitans sp.]|nr:DUF222 domain-containing protein [Jatrophihabitans sp.]